MTNYSNGIIGMLELACPNAKKKDIQICNKIYEKIQAAIATCVLGEVKITARNFVRALQMVDNGVPLFNALNLEVQSMACYDHSDRLTILEFIKEACSEKVVTCSSGTDFIAAFQHNPAEFQNRVASENVRNRLMVANELGNALNSVHKHNLTSQSSDFCNQAITLLETLARDEHSVVRATVARFAHILDENVVIALANDSDFDVRYAVATNPVIRKAIASYAQQRSCEDTIAFYKSGTFAKLATTTELPIHNTYVYFMQLDMLSHIDEWSPATFGRGVTDMVCKALVVYSSDIYAKMD